MTDAVISDYCASLCLDCLHAMIGDHEREAERLATVSAPLVANFNATLGAVGVRAADADAFERERTAILRSLPCASAMPSPTFPRPTGASPTWRARNCGGASRPEPRRR